MGIKSIVAKVAGKAADAVHKVSSLSPSQLEDIERRRAEYLSQEPSPDDPEARELTLRLMSAIGVEIHDDYLSRLEDLYVPVDPEAEYGRPFDAGHNIRYFDITKWVVDESEDSLEKLVSVYAVLSNEPCNIALVFDRTCRGTKAYLAVVNLRNSGSNVDVEAYRRRLADAVIGNFPGSQLGEGTVGVPPCLSRLESRSVATISNVPGEKSERFATQTIERILDGVIPTTPIQEYTIVLLASPVLNAEDRQLRLGELYSGLAPYASWQTDFTLQESDSEMSTATVGLNIGASHGSQVGTGQTVNVNESETDSRNYSEGETTTDSISDSESTTTGQSDTDTAGVHAGVGLGDNGVGVGGSYSHGHTTSEAETLGRTVTQATGRAITNTLGRAVTRGVGTALSVTDALTRGANFGANFARSSSVTATIGKSEGIHQSFTNFTVKHALELLESQMKRLDQAAALGTWDFAAYVLSRDQGVANNVAHSYLALTQGEGSHLSKACVNLWRGDLADDERARTICAYLGDLRHPLFGLDPEALEFDGTLATYPTSVSPTTLLSGKELAYSLNFPQRSVSGLPVIDCVAFGRNVSKFDEAPEGDSLRLGRIFHMHHEEPTDVDLSLESLSSHVFVVGSTGSGKSTTVYRMISEARRKGIGFLVVEPAKGEYKQVFGGDEEVSVYGTNPSLCRLLRVNPFAFPQSIHVLEHLDRLVEVFGACWPMYAAMPAVLKEAIERSYADCGWDLTESTNRYGDALFPTFSDVVRNVRTIIDTSDYDAENKGAYKGSLITRLQSLTTGINGTIFGGVAISDEELFDRNAIVDLSRVGSTETKALIMGILVLKMQEHRMAAAVGQNAALRHMTVLEEAHALLRRTAPVQSAEGGNLQGKSVEMLSNAIAEMRTYGEGFVIVDQAPGLLDLAAIRNTNTKVIMRLPDEEDRELVGRAANLNDDQVRELARLPRGVAAVYQNDWIEPVLCKVEPPRDPATGFEYSPSEVDVGKRDEVAVAEVVRLLLERGGEVAPGEDALRVLLDETGLEASVRVAVLRALEDQSHPRQFSRVAPVLARLYPDARVAVAKAYHAKERGGSLSAVVNGTLPSALEGVSMTLRWAVVQGVIEDYLVNEAGDRRAFDEWHMLRKEGRA